MAGFMPSDYSSASPSAKAGEMAHPQFIFPVLKNSEILQCMSELLIDLSKQELTEPQRHKEKLRKVFWQLLEICCGITEEDLVKQSPSQENLEYSELHEDFTDLLFFRELQNCMKACGVYDFSLKDLHYPTAKRLRYQLSGVINMAKFREEQLKVYSELNEPRAELLLALEEIHKEHAQLTEQLQEVQQESSVKTNEIEQVMHECEESEADIARKYKSLAAKREESDTLKREVNDLKDQVASATWALQEAQGEEERLMGKVVSSPNRRKDELETKKERLEKEKDELRGMQDEIEENKTRQAHLQQTLKDLEDTISLQQQVLEEAEKYEEAMGKVHATEREVSENQEKIREIINKGDEAERALARSEEKLQHTRKQATMKMDAAQDRLEISKEQLLLVEKERREGNARAESGEAKVRDLEMLMKTEQADADQEIADLVEQYKEAERSFLQRNENRLQVVEAGL